MNLLPKILPRTAAQDEASLERSMMQREAEIGGKLFGPIPKGHTRQFFCFDEHTWIWHETWKDSKGHQKSVTTKYETRPNGVIKYQDGQGYQRLTLEEARNLYQAVGLYHERITADYQRMFRTA